ncbi:MAG: elongation factor P, partial [Candidatus Kerfeldbacteria bacterium]|nr:elongation factor P [Candidatus Kerfeldbacteria bacterium]
MNDLRPGVIFVLDGEPYVILKSDFMRTAQRKPVRQGKVRGLVSGKVLDLTFNFNAKYEEADVERGTATVLYGDEQGFTFMDSETFDQFTLSRDALADVAEYLKDGLEVMVVRFEGNPISIEPPKKVDLKVTDTMDAVKGDTAQGSVLKEATLETG